MERVVKFRGRNYDGTWMYGYLMPTPKPQIHPNNKYSISVSPQALTSVDKALYEVETDTIGQFTGLTDKNGKEIYEGDIVANDFGNAYIVNMTVEWCTDGYWALHEIDGDDTMHFVADYLKEIEIIGNIYDTPNFSTDGND